MAVPMWIAVAIAVNQSTAIRQELRLRPGESGFVEGHRLAFEGVRRVAFVNRASIIASVRVDGGQVYEPAISNYPFASQGIGTPSVKTGALEDIYLTLVSAPSDPSDPVVIGVVIQPLAVWLWIGGGVMALGTALAAVPRRRSPRPGAHRKGGEAPLVVAST